MNIENSRKILMDHYTKPVNKGFIETTNDYKKDLKSDSCSDELTIQVDYDDKKIKDIRFEGTACVIATSSSDILFSILKDKTFEEAISIANDYENMIVNGEQPSEQIKELSIFENIHKQKNRQKCATLGVNGVIEFLNDVKK